MNNARRNRRQAQHLLGLERYDSRYTHRSAASSTPREPPIPRSQFSEIEGGAFFVGKLNKYKDRDEIYSGLRNLADRYGFYIRKLDMPFADTISKRGNKGFCFVHCRSRQEAQRMIALRDVILGDQAVEIRPYSARPEASGLMSGHSSGYDTPLQSGSHYPAAYTHNPLAIKEPINIMPDGATSDFPQSDGSFGPKSVRSSEFSDECESVRGGEFAPASLQPVQQTVSRDSVYSCQPPMDFQTVPMPTVEIWDQIYSQANVDKFVASQLYAAQSRGVNPEEFYQRYVQSYNEYLNALNTQYSTNADGVADIALTYAPLLLSS